MAVCVNHPDREACAVCMKYGYGYCRECCACTDPSIYCQYRQSCLVWALCERGNKADCPPPRSAAQPPPQPHDDEPAAK